MTIFEEGFYQVPPYYNVSSRKDIFIKKIIISTVFIILSFIAICYSGQNPTIEELLAKYEQTQINMKNIHFKSETIMEEKDSLAKESNLTACRAEFYTDGTRIDLTVGESIHISNKDYREIPDSGYSTRLIWDENHWYQHKRPEKSEDQRVFISKREKWKKDYLFNVYAVAIDGYFIGDSNTVSSIFRNADQIKLYEEQENINGVSCYVLEAISKYGMHKIWIDPEHGYNICQAEVVKNRNDLFDSKPLSNPPPEDIANLRITLPEGQPPLITKSKVEAILTVNNVKFQEYNDVWIPISGDWKHTVAYEDGRILTALFNYKKYDIELSPDFKEAKTFEPNIPNGTTVRIEGENLFIPLYWQNGKVVDSNDIEVDLKTSKPSPQ
jgi:hypothetical protein